MATLNFHRVERPTGLELTRLSPARFEHVLDTVASMAPETTLTFDDGFASICEGALPSILRRGLRAVVFLISDHVGGFDDWDVRILGRRRPMMSWAQAREWSEAGIDFGSHTRHHRDLTALPECRLRDELAGSKKEIEDHLGRTVRYLSYPFGRHDTRVRDAAREVGYESAYAIAGIPGDDFAMSRVNVHGLMTMAELRGVVRGGKPTWRTNLFSALSAGSATVGNWGPSSGGIEVGGR